MGYCGKIARVDLSSRAVDIMRPDELFYRTYLGGRGFIAHALLQEVWTAVKPFDAENVIVFAPGVLTGSPVPGSGRHSVGALSPLTNGFGDGEAGGFWGVELKKAGLDALIIKGRAEAPCYIWINDGAVEIKDAGHLWGRSTLEVDRSLRAELGSKIRVAQCGPAGENGVHFACVVHDLRHFVGRSGIGGVMGSKNLRAVAVRGANPIPLADPEGLSAFAKQNTKKALGANGLFHSLGTAGLFEFMNQAGALPTRNFREGMFEGSSELDGAMIQERYISGRHSCFACPVRCKPEVTLDGEYKVGPETGGPEYETLAALGSLCGVSDLPTVLKANELCNLYGLDTISTGGVVAFAMECAEKGLIAPSDLDGQKLGFGDGAGMLALIEKIANGRGLGRLLALGVKQAAAEIGGEAPRLAMHVRGQEIPMHEPRQKYALGLGYAMSVTGADHMHNMHDTAVAGGPGAMAEFGFSGALDPQSLDMKKLAIFKYASTWRYLADCAVVCMFMPYGPAQLRDIINLNCGWNTTTVELFRVAQRSITMSRAFNIARGLNPEDEVLPDRFHQAFSKGPLAGKRLSPKDFVQARQSFYRMMNYDQQGVPTIELLAELGLDWVAERYPEIWP